MTVFITNEQDKIEIPAEWEEKINQVAAICLREEQLPEDVEVDLLFVDNEAIREMNLEYRDKDSATDVLSFPMYEPDEEIDDEEEVLLGDIVISLEREVMYLLVHGLLHLAGYDHMEEEDKKVMRAQEEKLLAQIGAIR